MFYVSVSKEVLRKVEQHAKSRPEEEVLGFLIGRMEDQAPSVLIVEDAISGETVSERYRVTMPKETIAKIADDIITGRIKGNIVGWYHSHPGLGLFLSDHDIATQARLQQFSPYIVALVIDPKRDEVSFFTLNMQTKASIPIRDESVYIFSPGEDPIPSEWLTYAPPPPPSVIGGPPPRMPPEGRVSEKAPSKKPFHLIIAALAAALIITSSFAGLYFLQKPTFPEIMHEPITQRPYKTEISVEANVTDPDGIDSVVLYYSLLGHNESTSCDMYRKSTTAATNSTVTASATIPADYVTGNITYFIRATDTKGFANSTELRKIVVHCPDFYLGFDPQIINAITVGAGETLTFNITLKTFIEWPIQDTDVVILDCFSRNASCPFEYTFNVTELSLGKPNATLTIQMDYYIPKREKGPYTILIRAKLDEKIHEYELNIVIE